MVENKCIHVDRAQAAAVQDPNTKLPPDHWQALIALHRTLLHDSLTVFSYVLQLVGFTARKIAVSVWNVILGSSGFSASFLLFPLTP